MHWENSINLSGSNVFIYLASRFNAFFYLLHGDKNYSSGSISSDFNSIFSKLSECKNKMIFNNDYFDKSCFWFENKKLYLFIK